MQQRRGDSHRCASITCVHLQAQPCNRTCVALICDVHVACANRAVQKSSATETGDACGGKRSIFQCLCIARLAPHTFHTLDHLQDRGLPWFLPRLGRQHAQGCAAEQHPPGGLRAAQDVAGDQEGKNRHVMGL